MVLKNRVKTYREKLNMKQQEFGELCGVSMQTIGAIERGSIHSLSILLLRLQKIAEFRLKRYFIYKRKMKIKR